MLRRVNSKPWIDLEPLDPLPVIPTIEELAATEDQSLVEDPDQIRDLVFFDACPEPIRRALRNTVFDWNGEAAWRALQKGCSVHLLKQMIGQLDRQRMAALPWR